MKLKDLSNQLEISLESLQNFIFDFNLDISQCVDEKLEITEIFKKFAVENIDFLKKYAQDHNKEKTIEQIAQENTEQTIIEFLSMVLKFHQQDTDPEAMKQVLSKIDLSYLTLLFNKVQEMCHIGNVNTDEVFREFS